MSKPFKDYCLYKPKGREYWYYKLPNMPRYASTGMKNKTAAEAYCIELLKQGGKRRQKIRLKDYTANFFVWDKCSYIKRQLAKGKRFSEAHAKGRRGSLVKYIWPAFGHRYLDTLTVNDIENWLLTLQTEYTEDGKKKYRPLSNQSKNHIYYTFSTIMNEALRDNLIISDPFDHAEPMAKDYNPREVYSIAELATLFPFIFYFFFYIFLDKVNKMI